MRSCKGHDHHLFISLWRLLGKRSYICRRTFPEPARPVGRRVPRRCDGGARMAAGGSRHARPCCGLLCVACGKRQRVLDGSRATQLARAVRAAVCPRLGVMNAIGGGPRTDVGSGDSVGLGWVGLGWLVAGNEPGMDRVLDPLFRHSRARLRRWATRLRRLWLLLPGAAVRVWRLAAKASSVTCTAYNTASSDVGRYECTGFPKTHHASTEIAAMLGKLWSSLPVAAAAIINDKTRFC